MEENLLTSARRVVRFFNIDNTSGGGLISTETTGAVETLDKQVRAEDMRLKMERERAEQASKASAHEA
jgi:hypothetical protein